MKHKALLGFSRLRDEELLRVSMTIHDALIDNPYFLQPTPELSVLQDALEEFGSKLATSKKRGSPEDTALKNESRTLLLQVLQQLNYYVNSTANGRLAVLLSSGFPISSRTTVTQVPLAVDGVRVRDGRQSGQVRLDFNHQLKVLVYEYIYRIEGSGEEGWADRLVTSSSRMNIVAPLEVGKMYEFKVRAVNSQGAGDWSSIAKILVR